MILSIKNNQSEKCSSLLEAMERLTGAKAMGFAPVVSIVGAGGKTTLLHEFANEYAASGQKVIVTTTTRILQEDQPFFQIGNKICLDKTKGILEKYGQVWLGETTDRGKVKMPSKELLEELFQWKLPVLIEADGARKLPVKVPAAHEPVLLKETTHVLSVFGLDALGKQIGEVCFRPDLAEKLLKKSQTDRLNEEDLALLAVSRHAGRKGCNDRQEYVVVLNKADDQTRVDAAKRIGSRLYEMGINKMLITSFDIEDRKRMDRTK